MLEKQPRLVVFVGTVGSGKSTQMELVAYKLRRKGFKTKVSTLKTNHLLSHLLTIAVQRILVNSERNPFTIGVLIERKPLVLKKLFRLWLVLDAFSISVKFIWDVALPLRSGRIVLVEEYLPAIITDYAYISKAVGLSPNVTIGVIRFLSRILSSPGFMEIVFLDASQIVLQERWKLRGSPREKAEYLQIQQTLLLLCSEKLSDHRLLRVDTTTQSVTETNEYVLTHLGLSGISAR